MQRGPVDQANFAFMNTNWTNGLFILQLFGEGRFLTFTGLRYTFLVVDNQSETMSCHQSLKIGQMIW